MLQIGDIVKPTKGYHQIDEKFKIINIEFNKDKMENRYYIVPIKIINPDEYDVLVYYDYELEKI